MVLHPNLVELYQRKTGQLQAALPDTEERTEALEIIRSLIERVVVSPSGDGYEIELVGAIAEMIVLANAGISPGNTDENAINLEIFRNSAKGVRGQD